MSLLQRSFGSAQRLKLNKPNSQRNLAGSSCYFRLWFPQLLSTERHERFSQKVHLFHWQAAVGVICQVWVSPSVVMEHERKLVLQLFVQAESWSRWKPSFGVETSSNIQLADTGIRLTRNWDIYYAVVREMPFFSSQYLLYLNVHSRKLTLSCTRVVHMSIKITREYIRRLSWVCPHEAKWCFMKIRFMVSHRTPLERLS